MTGLPDLNFPAFARMAEALRVYGFSVIDPSQNFAGDPHRPRAEYMRCDLMQLLALNPAVDRLAALPGWRGSKGARLELAVAAECGIVCWEVRLDPDRTVDWYRLAPEDIPVAICPEEVR